MVREDSVHMIKITGLDNLQRELKKAQEALSELDGELGTVAIDPEDPASIDQAIAAMERIIDTKVAGYENNEFIGPLAEELKENCRSIILDKAAEARLKGDE